MSSDRKNIRDEDSCDDHSIDGNGNSSRSGTGNEIHGRRTVSSNVTDGDDGTNGNAQDVADRSIKKLLKIIDEALQIIGTDGVNGHFDTGSVPSSSSTNSDVSHPRRQLRESNIDDRVYHFERSFNKDV